MPKVNQHAQYIFTVSGFLSDEECDGWIELSESIGCSPATVNSPGAAPNLATNIRNNDRVSVDDVARTALLWKLAEPHCPKYYKGYSIIGLNERLRFYRYDRGHVFRWHADGIFRRENGESSRLTFIVYLNDKYDGDETLFEDVTISPQKAWH